MNIFFFFKIFVEPKLIPINSNFTNIFKKFARKNNRLILIRYFQNKTKDGEERYERYDYIDPRGILISMFPNRKMEVKAFANKTECVKSDFTPWGAVLLGANDPFGFCPDLLCTCNDLNPKHLRFFDLRWVKADDDK